MTASNGKEVLSEALSLIAYNPAQTGYATTLQGGDPIDFLQYIKYVQLNTLDGTYQSQQMPDFPAMLLFWVSLIVAIAAVAIFAILYLTTKRDEQKRSVWLVILLGLAVGSVAWACFALLMTILLFAFQLVFGHVAVF